MKKLGIALLLAMLAACSTLSDLAPTSVAGKIKIMDENDCAAAHLQFCVGQVWLYFRWKMNMLKEYVHESNHVHSS